MRTHLGGAARRSKQFLNLGTDLISLYCIRRKGEAGQEGKLPPSYTASRKFNERERRFQKLTAIHCT